MNIPGEWDARSFLEARIARAARGVVVTARPLRGGLVSRSVLHIAAHSSERREGLTHFVVKHLAPGAEREANVYRILRAAGLQDLAPVSFGTGQAPDEGRWLYLERIAPCSAWPWCRLEPVEQVLTSLAFLHERGARAAGALESDDWDYETELLERAELTARLAERCAAELDGSLGASLPALRRVVTELPMLRRRLRELRELPPTLLHGDVHSGNVLLRQRGTRVHAVLLDWGRARIGSPLEDVSSWLQSLAFWEPLVRRKHDTLLCSYLKARGLETPASREIRDAYWLAAASNCLAGALSHHLAQATGAASRGRERCTALRAAHDWLRIIRRVDQCWRLSSPARAHLTPRSSAPGRRRS